jgi:hypothetical protein
MNKRKCRNRECNQFFRPPITEIYIKAFWCSPECKEAIAIANLHKQQANRLKAREKAEKKADKAHSKRKREFNQNDVKVRRPAAKKACHEYIRLRDFGKNCICCNKPLGENYHAGHFLESGNNPFVRYDENNISAQKIDCNYFKGGDSGDYEKNLRIKIGDEAVDLLLTKKGGTLKRTGQDYAEIEAYYKDKIKGMNCVDITSHIL